MTRVRISALLGVVLLALSACGSGAAEELKQLKTDLEAARAKVAKLESELGALSGGCTVDEEPTTAESGPPTVVLEVGTGSVSVDGKQLTVEELDERLRAAQAEDSRTQVVVKPGEGVRHGTIVELLERIMGHGLKRIAIATGDDE